MIILDSPRNSCNYNESGTTTFRLGSKMLTLALTRPPRDGKAGSNMQNWEKSVREIYVPDGYTISLRDKCIHYLNTKDLSVFTDEERRKLKIFVQVDQAGAEALIVAYLCKHANYRDLILNGIKAHVFVALHVFKEQWKEEVRDFGIDLRPDIDLLCNTPIKELNSVPYWNSVKKLIASSDSWPEQKRYYYIAKMIVHASNYGMRPPAFQLNVLEKSRGKIVISKKEAEFYLGTYHSLFPEIRAWHRDIEGLLIQFRTLYNLFGFPREFWFPSVNTDYSVLKEAYAFIPQSTVGTITNIAFTKLQKDIEDNNRPIDLLANTHDSYLVQCPVGDEAAVGKLMQDYINMELKSPRGEPFRMKSEAKAGFNWNDATELPDGKWKNPEGLRSV